MLNIHKIMGLTLGMLLLSTAAFADHTITHASAVPTESATGVQGAINGEGQKVSLDKEELKKHREEMQEKFASRLNLTDEQRAKAKELHEKNRAEMKKIMDEIDVLKEKAKGLREQSKTEFEALLTPEQKETLAQMHQEREAKMEKMKDKHHFKDKMKRKKSHSFSAEKPMMPKEAPKD